MCCIINACYVQTDAGGWIFSACQEPVKVPWWATAGSSTRPVPLHVSRLKTRKGQTAPECVTEFSLFGSEKCKISDSRAVGTVASEQNAHVYILSNGGTRLDYYCSVFRFLRLEAASITVRKRKSVKLAQPPLQLISPNTRAREVIDLLTRVLGKPFQLIKTGCHLGPSSPRPNNRWRRSGPRGEGAEPFQTGISLQNLTLGYFQGSYAVASLCFSASGSKFGSMDTPHNSWLQLEVHVAEDVKTSQKSQISTSTRLN